MSTDLEQQVRELTAANDGLRRELAECRASRDEIQAQHREVSWIINHTPAFLTLSKATGGIEIANRAILEYAGKTLEELRDWRRTGFLHPDDFAGASKSYAAAIKEGRAFRFEQRYRRADGEYRWFEVWGHPVKDEDGRVLRWCGTQIDIDDRKRAEAALHTSVTAYRRIIDNIPAAIAVTIPKIGLSFINRQLANYAGTTAEGFTNWLTGNVFHPGDMEPTIEALRKFYSGGTPFDIEHRIRRYDGAYRWFHTRGTLEPDPESGPPSTYFATTDVDDRKRAEALLRESERNARLIVNSIPGQVAVLLPTGAIEYVNDPLAAYTGRTADQMQEWGSDGTVHPEDVPRIVPRFMQSMGSGDPYEFEGRIRRFDGVYRWFQIRGLALRGEDGSIVRWYSTLSDVDDRRRAEDALRASERNLQLTVDTIPALVWSTTPDRRTDFFNEHYLRFVGLSGQPAEGWDWTATVHPDDVPALGAMQQALLASGKAGEAEVRLRRHDGEYRWFLIRTSPLRDESGAIVKWYGVNTDIEDRKRAEAQLRRAYDSFADAQRLSHTGSFITDLVGDDHNWSEETYRIFEFEPGSKVSLERIQKVIHPDDVETFGAMIQKALGGADVEFLFRIFTPQGAIKHIRGLAHVVEKVTGRPLFVGALRDVTESRIAEEALAASERNLKQTIDTIPALAWSTRPDGWAEFFNQHYLDYVGLTIGQAEGWGWTAAVHADDLPGLGAVWQAFLASGTAGETEARLRRHDGIYRWFLFRTNPLRDPGGAILKWHGINTDIEDRKRAEDELRRSEAFLAEGQRLSQTGSFSWRTSTDQIVFSDELCRIFEFAPGTVPTIANIASRVHPLDLALVQDKIEYARRGGKDLDYGVRLQMPDGRIKHLQTFAHGLVHGDGELEILGAMLDVTQRKLAEETLDRTRSELAHAARAMSLGALTASIAHEVNQPLAGIITNSNTCLRMLAADPPNVDGAKETVRRTIRDGNRASEVIKRLRALFGKKPVATEAVDLNEAAREVLSLSQGELQRNHIAVQEEFASDIPRVTGDRVQLQQVILNLLLNASEAMSGVQGRPRQVVIKTDRDAEGNVRLSVRDSGVGLAPEVADRIFEPFYTTKADGMGIGLSVSRSIIENHLGRMSASANDGPGATFSFSIPPQGDVATRASSGISSHPEAVTGRPP